MMNQDHMRPTLPQKFHLAYHLVIGGGQLWTPLLGAPIAPEALHRCAQAHGAWTDVGKMRWYGARI